MESTAPKLRVAWYRCPVSREDLKSLNQRSDFWGFAQTLGFLGWLTLTGAAAYFAPQYLPLSWYKWPLVVLLFFIHGTGWHFLINGFHELVHDSVFKTRWLNAFFLRIFSFLGWYNHHDFWASHTEHHKYTLHPPDDLEVVLPVKYSVRDFLKIAVINPMAIKWMVGTAIRLARGKLSGEWEHALFDNAPPEVRRRLFNWGRILLVGHGAIVAISIYMHWWLLPVVVTLAPCYGKALHFLLNSSQHVGLSDKVNDFRLCCRTIYVNPFFQFLYWHMNYHTEHHMYAAVPCYNLPRLHRIIKQDMPKCPSGVVETWRQIGTIIERQKTEPGYQYVAELPSPARGRRSSRKQNDLNNSPQARP